MSPGICVNGRDVPDILRTSHFSEVCVGQLVEVLRYKLQGHRFDSQWGYLDLLLTWSLWPHYGPGVNSTSNTNEYRGCLLGKKGAIHRAHNLATFILQMSRNSRSLNLLEPSGPVKTCKGIAFRVLWNAGSDSPSNALPQCRRSAPYETMPWETQTLYVQVLQSRVPQTNCYELVPVCTNPRKLRLLLPT
jgi:hypothetical protein